MSSGSHRVLINDGSIGAVHGSRKIVSVWKPGAMKSVLVSFERA